MQPGLLKTNGVGRFSYLHHLKRCNAGFKNKFSRRDKEVVEDIKIFIKVANGSANIMRIIT
ncbi:hypothetical protein AGMMS50233_01720 [Endomicrobiia bacterium]|nr:hypothetical protein AGMMS49990_06040 [Endomicrobiia bacterium]GHT54190.1 hypothetical protein AGMMS50233_01720 [Endomicrobiia bacterium]